LSRFSFCGLALRVYGSIDGCAYSLDAINTRRVSAGDCAYFRVVSRRQIQYFRSSRRFMRLVRFPAAPLQGAGPQISGPFSLKDRSKMPECHPS
jgi:hypothetical protein